MADVRLTVRSLSRNDISILATCLEQSFDYYLNYNSPFFNDYLCSLRTLVGLGFAAALADRSLFAIYQGYLNHFIRYKEGNFREASGAKRHIAQSTAEMVGTAVISFKALNHPRYYGNFFQALQTILTKIPSVGTEAERILSGLVVSQ